MGEIAKTGSVAHINGIDEKVKEIFVTAHDITPKSHVMMQAAFQLHTDNAVSKTVNFEEDATLEDVAEAYVLAYKNDLKGITVYRNNSRFSQPMLLESKKEEKQAETVEAKVEHKELIFNDLVKGELKFDTNLIGDFVIMKSNGTPTYNFAVVIDDMLMKISHIIRGEDHISNTPKQILIYEALGAEVPKFGHLGMILAPDRSKLSKRHGATAVSDFVKQGYLTDALINFVALLGWAPSDGVEIKPVDEIAKDFRIHDVSSSNSIFEYDKLNWMNGQYIKKMDISKLTDMALPFLSKYDSAEFGEHGLSKMSRENLEK